MATVRISQLTAITTPTDDDVFIINDADTNTRKISFANLTQGLLNDSSTPQTKLGPLTIDGTLTASGNLVVDTNTLFVDATNNRVGVGTIAPDVELDVNGSVHVRNANSVRFGDTNNSNYVALKAPTVVPANYTLTLPSSPSSATNLLAVSSAGVIEYSVGVIYNSVDDVLELNALRLTDQGAVRFYENNTNGSEYISLSAPASLATTNLYTLPPAAPAVSGYVLSATTSGVMSWVSNSAGAGGNIGEIQINVGGSLGGDSNLTWNSGTNTLGVANVAATGALSVAGNVDLGDANTDTISFIGRADTDLVPIADGAHDLGTSSLHWAEIHANDIFAYGGTRIGNNSTDTLSVTATVISDLLPTTATYDLGGPSNLWAAIYTTNIYAGDGEIVQNSVARQTVYFNAAVNSAASFNVNLGSESAYVGYKLQIIARDNVTGDVEMYEHLIVQDGGGGISEASASNVQAPTPGTFLTTPATAISGSDVVCSVTNSALSGNPVSITVRAVAIDAL